MTSHKYMTDMSDLYDSLNWLVIHFEKPKFRCPWDPNLDKCPKSCP